jgi:hypothetical protein
MARTALYRDVLPFRPARAEVQLEADTLVLHLPDGRTQRHSLHGAHATTSDGCVAEPAARGSSENIDIVTLRGSAVRTIPRVLRRFVRMLVLDGGRRGEHVHLITPPDHGAVAPNVVSVPEAPADAAVLDTHAWEALSDWLLGGGRLSALSVSDLARIACISTPQFAALVGEVAAQRALEQVWASSGPLRGGIDLDTALQPLHDAARHSARAGEALVSALAHAAGATRRRFRWFR